MYHEKPEVFWLVLFLSIVTNFHAILYCVSFFRASNVSPGRIPDEPPWNVISSDEDLVKLTESKRGGGVRFCRWCRLIKPDRAHHCRMCDRCTLKMDHHCPWLDNCIGFGNLKFFVLTLYYGTISVLLMSASSGWLGYYVTNHTDMMGIEISRLVLGIVVATVCGLMGIVLTVFLGTHISMILQGVTTIEVFEKRGFGMVTKDEGCFRTICCPAKDPVTGKPINGGSIYRLPTMMGNMKAALGDDVWLWWAPTLPKRGSGSTDGLYFQTTQDMDREAVEMSDDSPLMSQRVET